MNLKLLASLFNFFLSYSFIRSLHLKILEAQSHIFNPVQLKIFHLSLYCCYFEYLHLNLQRIDYVALLVS